MRGRNFTFLREQKPEGYWVGELMVDCTLVADVVAFHHWNGTVNENWQRKAVNHLFRLQMSGGGWNIYPGRPGGNQRQRQGLPGAQAEPGCR